MDGKKVNLVILDEITEGKHARVAFPADFDSWCDAGDHEIKEGELILKTDAWPGYVHLFCL